MSYKIIQNYHIFNIKIFFSKIFITYFVYVTDFYFFIFTAEWASAPYQSLFSPQSTAFQILGDLVHEKQLYNLQYRMVVLSKLLGAIPGYHTVPVNLSNTGYHVAYQSRKAQILSGRNCMCSSKISYLDA